MNPKWCEITGYSLEELLQKRFQDITHPDDVPMEMDQYRQLFAGQITLYDLEKRCIRKNGQICWVHVHRSAVKAGEKISHGIGILQDVTKRKIAEAALREAQKQLKQHAKELETKVKERTAELLKSNEAMESFCYTLAHDLRAPLRAMKGFSMALVQDYGTVLDATGKDYTERISNSCSRMDTLIQDLLAFGQLTHVELPRQEIELESAVRNALARFTDEIQFRRAQIEVLRPMPSVQANITVLDQILMNLISNALTFVAPNVEPRVRIRAELKQDTVKIYIEDNGIGISPEYQERIFQPFEKLNPTERARGTGIGLAIVQRGVERLGGKVGLESEVGKGSCFWIELPAAKSNPTFPL